MADLMPQIALSQGVISRRFRLGHLASGAMAANGEGGRTDPQAVVSGWMDSPGHRANILHPNMRFIGVGSHVGGAWGNFNYMLLTANPTVGTAAITQQPQMC